MVGFVCPHNGNNHCYDGSDGPIRRADDASFYCIVGDCAYIWQLNMMDSHADTLTEIKDSVNRIIDNLGGDPDNNDSIGEMLYSLRRNIGGEVEEDPTISQKLDQIIANLGGDPDNGDSIGEMLFDLRRNIGAEGEDDGTIAGRLDSICSDM